jgi:hypothetical protein
LVVTKTTMTDAQRKSVALEYLKAFDNKGVTCSGASILDLFRRAGLLSEVGARHRQKTDT